MSLPAVVLYQPRIPPNAGNVIRLCANTGAKLHFIHPLGFSLDHAQLRRAGLDYHELASLYEHKSLEDFIATTRPRAIFAFSTRGAVTHDRIRYEASDALLFGPETCGLPAAELAGLVEDAWVRIPMLGGSRSMNLANSVAVAVYEAWRQQGFAGADPAPQTLKRR